MRLNKNYLCFILIFIITVLYNVRGTSQDRAHNEGEKIKKVKEIWLDYAPSMVTLEGIIERGRFYGPPGYGENPRKDRIEVVYFVKLAKPINVRGNPMSDINSETERDLKKVQLSKVLEIWQTLKGMVGRRVVIKGHLFHALTGHDHTRVVIDVSDISMLEPSSSDQL